MGGIFLGERPIKSTEEYRLEVLREAIPTMLEHLFRRLKVMPTWREELAGCIQLINRVVEELQAAEIRVQKEVEKEIYKEIWAQQAFIIRALELPEREYRALQGGYERGEIKVPIMEATEKDLLAVQSIGSARCKVILAARTALLAARTALPSLTGAPGEENKYYGTSRARVRG